MISWSLMDRRTFTKLIGAGSTALARAGHNLAVHTSSVWPQTVFRRFSADIHVPDWDSRLLGRFDAAAFVGNIARAGAQSFLMFSNSHVGLCLWRTRSVEVLLFHQPGEKRLLVIRLSLQKQLPRIAVSGALRVRVPPGYTARRVVQLPARSAVPFETRWTYAHFRVEEFDTLAMVALEYA